MNFIGIASAAFALVVWGVTFANTRALLLCVKANWISHMIASFP